MMAKTGSAAPQKQAESLPPPPLPPGVTAPVQTGAQPPPSTRPPIAPPGSWPRAQQTPPVITISRHERGVTTEQRAERARTPAPDAPATDSQHIGQDGGTST